MLRKVDVGEVLVMLGVTLIDNIGTEFRDLNRTCLLKITLDDGNTLYFYFDPSKMFETKGWVVKDKELWINVSMLVTPELLANLIAQSRTLSVEQSGLKVTMTFNTDMVFEDKEGKMYAS
jgi:hypothetical protein